MDTAQFEPKKNFFSAKLAQLTGVFALCTSSLPSIGGGRLQSQQVPNSTSTSTSTSIKSQGSPKVGRFGQRWMSSISVMCSSSESQCSRSAPHFLRGRLRHSFGVALRKRARAKREGDEVSEGRAWKLFGLISSSFTGHGARVRLAATSWPAEPNISLQEMGVVDLFSARVRACQEAHFGTQCSE